MDPDEALQELRELYNSFQDGELTVWEGARALEVFDALDNWITGGGFLPKEWTR